MLEPVGFWSYTRHDDEQSDGALSQLRVIVGKAIALQHGTEVTLWQDVTAIPYGADWAEAIDDTLAKTTFFMPIVTPRYLKSPNCCEEYAAFRRHMSAVGRNDLVFPIHYVAVDKMTVEDTVFGEHLAALRRHQWIDFRGHFYADVRSAEIKKWAGQLAESILSTLRRPAPQARPVGPTADYGPPPVYEAQTPIEYPPRQAAPEPMQPPPAPPQAWTPPPPPPYEPPPPEQAAFQPSVYAADTATQSQAFVGGGYGRSDAPQQWPGYGGPGQQPPGGPNVGPMPMRASSSGSKRPLLIAAATAAGVLGIGGIVFGVIEMRRPAPTAPAKDSVATIVSPPAAPTIVPPPPKLPDSAHEKAGGPAGSPTALTSLGDKYYYGRGVPQDYAKALSYYEKAATAGSGEAMNDVGELYFYGRGVHQDYATAATWYAKAANAGNADGMTNLGSLYDVGYGVAIDHDKAKEWYEKAAAAGNADAMVALGWYYSIGRGISPDADASAEWYKKAVAAR